MLFLCPLKAKDFFNRTTLAVLSLEGYTVGLGWWNLSMGKSNYVLLLPYSLTDIRMKLCQVGPCETFLLSTSP